MTVLALWTLVAVCAILFKAWLIKTAVCGRRAATRLGRNLAADIAAADSWIYTCGLAGHIASLCAGLAWLFHLFVHPLPEPRNIIVGLLILGETLHAAKSALMFRAHRAQEDAELKELNRLRRLRKARPADVVKEEVRGS